MIDSLKESIWRQFGAGIDMLRNVISSCPEEYYATNKRFYYLAYHSVIFLDYYLTIPPTDFSPALTFTVKDKAERPAGAIGDMIPDRIYSRKELIDSLNDTRLKCKNLIDRLSANANQNPRFTEGTDKGDMDYPVLEILLYNMRHIQHHTGQLNLMLRQDLDLHVEWAFRVDELG